MGKQGVEVAVKGGEEVAHGDDVALVNGPGAGLGLPVARSIAEAHGGELIAESPPRAQPLAPSHLFAGTRVALRLPIHAQSGGDGRSNP